MPVSQIQNASLASGVPGKANLPTGSVLQVVQGTSTTRASTTSTTYLDTGLSANITPTSSSSKILVIVTHNGVLADINANCGVGIAILRGASNIWQISKFIGYYSSSSSGGPIVNCSGCYLDSPNTTSTTTYKTQFAVGQSVSPSGTAVINNNTDGSSIILMEIAA